MSGNKTKDMTVGTPWKLIISFAVPMIAGNLLQQLYNMADTLIVGRCLGVNALAAVGSTTSLCFMILGFCIGTSAGLAIPVAQSFGAEDYKSLRKYAFNAILLTALFSLILTVIVCIFCMEILQIMGTPAEIINQTNDYIFIIYLGIPITFYYNLSAGILRSLGNSKTPLLFLLISTALNVVLDLISILVLHMGVRGPAIATVISQGVSVVLCLGYMVQNYPFLHMSRDEMRPEGRMIGRLCYIGLPMGFQYSITGIGSTILQSSVNALGTMPVAAYAACTKIRSFFMCPFESLGGAMAFYTGQNVGAKKLDRVKQGLFAACMAGFIYGWAAFAFITIFGRQIGGLFFEANETQLISYTALFLHNESMLYTFIAPLNSLRFTIQGMGFSNFAVLAGVCEMIARTCMGLWVVPKFGFIAVTFASPAAWVAADCFLVPAFYYCLHKLRRRLGKSE